MRKESKDHLNEFPKTYVTNSSDHERLIKDVFRSDMDKLQLFTKMLRTNKTLNKAVITHK